MEKTAWTGKKPIGKVEDSVDVLHLLNWTVQPPLGFIKGEYYREENFFAPHYATDPGYHGILEVVKDGDRLVHVEFNEFTSPAYYIRKYQNVSKRRSEYCFLQSTKARTAQTLKVLDNGFTAIEEQMLRENRLTGDFELVTGASNSVKRSFLPLAAKVNAVLSQPSGRYYYGISEAQSEGFTTRLQVVIDAAGRILRCHYDEIFADDPEDIPDERLKKYYRTGKRESLEYESAYPDGFNVLFELLEQRVLATQKLTCVDGLPWTVDTENRKRNPEWDRYLALAKRIEEEAIKDGRLK